MYVEYIRRQRIADPNFTEYNPKESAYRPTWLIRTSDWKKVPGYEATNGYHALSYCWEQSGEAVSYPDGEHDCIDKGHHKITTKKKRHHKRVQTTQEVTYDKLLQQISKDFDIEYLWYDKVCIDQTNKAERRHEIKQMHLIYSNARYTLAFVPEIDIDDRKDFNRINWVTGYTIAKTKAMNQMMVSRWFHRSWTLEEVMMSTRILVVGRNTHFWSLANGAHNSQRSHYGRTESDLLSTSMLGFKERSVKSTNQILHFAHFRTSTKEHDKIFALANVIEGMVSIDVDYKSDVSTAMNKFYRQLVEKDLSPMCFGSGSLPDGSPQSVTTMSSYGLPSWTGVSGRHSYFPIVDITLDQNCNYTIDENMQLHIQCRSYAIRPSKCNDYHIYHYDDERRKIANRNYYNEITSMDDFNGNETKALDWCQWSMIGATGCISTHYYKPNNHAPFFSPILPLSLTEECDECIILGIVFNSVPAALVVNSNFASHGQDYLSPVAAKTAAGSLYRIIGTVLLKHFQLNERYISPQDVIDKMFNSIGCEPRDLSIK